MTDAKVLAKGRADVQEVANVLFRCKLGEIHEVNIRFLDGAPPSVEEAKKKWQRFERKAESNETWRKLQAGPDTIIEEIMDKRPAKTSSATALLVYWPPVLVYEDENSDVTKEVALDHEWASLEFEAEFPKLFETKDKINLLYDRKHRDGDVIADRHAFEASLTDEEKAELAIRPLGSRFAPAVLDRTLRESILRKFVVQTNEYQGWDQESQRLWNKMPTYGHRVTDLDGKTVREDIGL
jgi:hypothetical protein